MSAEHTMLADFKWNVVCGDGPLLSYPVELQVGMVIFAVQKEIPRANTLRFATYHGTVL
jgi:hypothetical protein